MTEKTATRLILRLVIFFAIVMLFVGMWASFSAKGAGSSEAQFMTLCYQWLDDDCNPNSDVISGTPQTELYDLCVDKFGQANAISLCQKKCLDGCI